MARKPGFWTARLSDIASLPELKVRSATSRRAVLRYFCLYKARFAAFLSTARWSSTDLMSLSQPTRSLTRSQREYESKLEDSGVRKPFTPTASNSTREPGYRGAERHIFSAR